RWLRRSLADARWVTSSKCRRTFGWARFSKCRRTSDEIAKPHKGTVTETLCNCAFGGNSCQHDGGHGVKGHIRERSPGHWAIVIDTRDPSTGRRRRKWHSFKGTKRQAQVECARLISEMKGGVYLEPNKTTVAQFLARWLEHIKPNVSPRTHERYTEI